MLAGSFTLAKIADRIQSLRQEYDNIKRAFPEFGKYTQDDFVWARLVVITRIFGLVINGHKTDGLVPYADMLNHKRPRECKWTFDDARYGFIITSLRAINRGEQVFDSYGAKCNSRFFVNYGFALVDNPDSEALMRVELPPHDPHFSMKLRFLGGRPICAQREFQIPANYNEKKCKELFSFMRFIHAQDSELMLLSSGEQFKLGEIEPISLRNEIAALKAIRSAAKISLAGFPGPSLADDQKQIEEGIADFNTRNCVIMRAGEKQVLQWFIDLADQALELLGMSWKNLKRVAAKAYKGSSKIDQYITAVVVPLVKRQ